MSRSNSDQQRDRRRSHGQSAVKLLAAALAVVFALWLFPVSVWADEGGYTTDEYKVNVITDADHVFHVSEEIKVDFSAPRHGIYRYIPDGEKYYSVKNVKVEGYNYETYSESGNTVVQIGDGDVYVSGVQIYRINYDIVGYRDDDDSKDMLALDLLPTGWSTPIQSAYVSFTLPKEADGLKYYTGAYGDTVPGSDYFDITQQGTTITAKSKTVLPKGYGLTVRGDLPEGYWVNPASREDSLPIMYGVLAVLGMLMLMLWLLVGRDDPVITTVEFYPPEDMDPLECAYVGNGKAVPRDIGALFMYFANKGYVTINQTGKKKFSMAKAADIAPTERFHSRDVFSTLFSRRSEVQLNKLPSSFGETAAKINGEVKESMGKNRVAFSTASRIGRAIGLFSCLLIPLLAGFFLYWLTFGDFGGLMVNLLCALVIFVTMITLVPKTDVFRTKKKPAGIIARFVILIAAMVAEAFVIAGSHPLLAVIFVLALLAAVVSTLFVKRRMNNEIFGRVLGFREFIRTAEYDRLKMLCDEDPSYYFNILPYACIFGMSTKWADKFTDFKIPQPAWYTGGTYDPMFGHWIYISSGHGLAGAAGDYYRAVSSDMLSSAADSGSGGGGGFGGGGFSGGGFGGGGGGSW